VDPAARPVQQLRRHLGLERQSAVKEEVAKLLKAGFIREVICPEWIANIVLVKESNGSWRMCIDYIDVNKACPKDLFLLPSIDHLVDSTARCPYLSFMDAFSNYNQIKIISADEHNTNFVTDHGLYRYKVMSFGLKNARATYQRMVNKVF
jgi:hypothetical protein